MPLTLEQALADWDMEAKWNDLLSFLKPWELHTIVKDETELFLHDAFVASDIGPTDVFACIEARLSLHINHTTEGGE